MNYEKHKRIIKSRLKPSRFNHTLNVVKMASKLARIHGANEEKVVMGALYHDYAKNLSDQELKAYIKHNNLKIDHFVWQNIFLSHGVVAAYMLEKEHNINDLDILNAIKYHTFGRRNMSLIEKIVYIADAIEIDRKYKHVDFIRELSYENIDVAIITYIDYFIEFAIKENKIIHLNTLDLRNEILENGILPRRV
ncbi:bis(5'-nucleosyl)-tetraphosphatase (symmetrical) YqeK [Helicovermis profundi]|uniref:bis(5'-nucleosyl)-tetraphosphatase (symmetrical) n=1 Tax=Helicovermis profundi TaxID=3065157 RepID=A0AAU9EGN6_9FIRM|nr:bis(5'-nucleosyl)-tetraphosphatase (symmetrical) YqeK [Clostridia bacterium S502]